MFAQLYLILNVVLVGQSCPIVCKCTGTIVDCSSKRLTTLDVLSNISTKTTRLQFNYNRISDIEENSFVNLTNLQYLYLHGNKISMIKQGSLNGLVMLQNLRLDNNRISVIERNAFMNLTNLKYLNLQSNRISDIEKIPTNLTNLKSLNLAYNQISTIKEGSLNGLKMLETLNLQSNRISNIEKIPTNLTTLKYLHLAYNQISTIKEESLNGLKMLQNLNLQSNRISDIEKIPTNLTNLKSLTLGYNQISTIKEGSLNGFKTLETLDLQRNQISTIRKGSLNGLVMLRTLRFNYNRISVVEQNSFMNLTNLKYLFLYGNQISTIKQGMLNGLVSLEYLWLYNNRISVIERNAFMNLTNLKYLNLNGNKLSTITPGLLYGLIMLENLKFSNNIISVMEQNSFVNLTNLKYLYLDRNQISAIKQGLFNRLEMLERLQLQNNRISVLKKNTFMNLTNLKYLYLNQNNISTIEKNAFMRLAKLKYLYLGTSNKCSCQSVYEVYLLQQTAAKTQYKCHSPIFNITSDVLRHRSMLQKFCTSEWSSWSGATQCFSNGFRKFTRKCLHNLYPCYGFNEKMEQCENLSFSSTSRIDGIIRFDNVMKNYERLSPHLMLKMVTNKDGTDYNAFIFVLKEAISWLFKSSSVNILSFNYTENIFEWETSAASVSYTAKVGKTLFGIERINPVKYDVNITLKRNNVIFRFTVLKNGSRITDFDECKNNEHNNCDKNADCLKFTGTIAYGCLCRKDFQGDGFSCTVKKLSLDGQTNEKTAVDIFMILFIVTAAILLMFITIVICVKQCKCHIQNKKKIGERGHCQIESNDVMETELTKCSSRDNDLDRAKETLSDIYNEPFEGLRYYNHYTNGE